VCLHLQVKLFLEQFSIKAAVLNAELPQNSRMHILDQFNRGICDIVVATDSAMEALEEDEDEEEQGEGEGADELVEHEFSEEEEEAISGDEKEEGEEEDDEEAAEAGEEEEEEEEEEEDGEEEKDEEVEVGQKRKKKDGGKAEKRQRSDNEYGVTRGIDFKVMFVKLNLHSLQLVVNPLIV
jgi:ATP-dependent RNA helicase DDX56/DBP9